MKHQVIQQFLKHLTLTLAIGLMSSPVYAEVPFDDIYRDQGIEMELKGTGVKSVFFLKAFVAGFYKEGEQSLENLGAFPKRIEVEYFVSIPSEKLKRFTVESMEDNVGRRQVDMLAGQIQMMGEYFVDLKPGDRFALTYLPDVGTKFEHNDKLTGVIQGSDFARALFSVWIGEKPFDDSLKEQILGFKKDKNRRDRVVFND